MRTLRRCGARRCTASWWRSTAACWLWAPSAGRLSAASTSARAGNGSWLSAWLESAVWPLLLVRMAASYCARRARDVDAPVVLAPPRILLAAAGLGLATGADNFVYTYGLAYIPVSTSSILISTQLVFFAFLVVQQRFTAASVNAVTLGLHVSGDRPAGVTKGQYWLGIVLTISAAALYGLILPLVELAYKRAAGGGRTVTYALVMEVQLVMGFFATALCTVGMIINKDFQVRAPGW
jgi:drug/metabolite transporter (DMT)-like permease